MADMMGTPEVPEMGMEAGMEAEGPLGSKLSLTVDDIPELSELQPGDSITFTIDDVSEDGSYALTVAPAEAADEEIPLTEEPVTEEGSSGGTDAVLGQLMS